jgi:hypothetical protein
MVVGQLGVYGVTVLLHAGEEAIQETEHAPIQVHNMAGNNAKVPQRMLYDVVCCCAQVCIPVYARCPSTQLVSIHELMNTTRYFLNTKHP